MHLFGGTAAAWRVCNAAMRRRAHVSSVPLSRIRIVPAGVQGRRASISFFPRLDARFVTTQILVLYDRSALGDLAVETGFQVAREQADATLHVLAVPGIADDAMQCERLADDLIAFARIGQRYGIALDGDVMAEPSVERINAEIRKRKIDRIITAKPDGQEGDNEISRLLDAVVQSTGIPAIVVHGVS
ncbi:universal stress protein [Dyella jejuensis]|uniref:Universal stress protein n=1 Tax=Dyella jejuensis TaxID=1432009 RepID=A0ABW8JGP3_9GAMM